MKQKNKLWIVKREVLAPSLNAALRVNGGRVYEISEAAREYQPADEKKVEGFTNKQ